MFMTKKLSHSIYCLVQCERKLKNVACKKETTEFQGLVVAVQFSFKQFQFQAIEIGLIFDNVRKLAKSRRRKN